jgi:hypothetical protein
MTLFGWYKEKKVDKNLPNTILKSAVSNVFYLFYVLCRLSTASTKKTREKVGHFFSKK